MLLHIPSLIVTFIYGCHALKSSFQRTHWTLKWPCHKIEFKAYSKPSLTSQPNRKAEEEEATHQCKNEEINWGEKSSSSIYPNSHPILIFILRSPWLSDDLLTDFLANFGGSWRSIFFRMSFRASKREDGSCTAIHVDVSDYDKSGSFRLSHLQIPFSSVIVWITSFKDKCS